MTLAVIGFVMAARVALLGHYQAYRGPTPPMGALEAPVADAYPPSKTVARTPASELESAEDLADSLSYLEIVWMACLPSVASSIFNTGSAYLAGIWMRADCCQNAAIHQQAD